MNCPRCGSRSVLRNHQTVACMSCSHVLGEPKREVRDVEQPSRHPPVNSGPAWTAAETFLWERDELLGR